MPAERICPNCQYRIPMEDINVSRDIALCRHCGSSFSFSLLEQGQTWKNLPLTDCPRSIRVEEDFNRKLIVYHRIWPGVWFLIPFTAFWSGFSMWGLYYDALRQTPPDWKRMLFGIPFLLGTIALLATIAFGLFGKWVIALEGGLGTMFVGVGSLGRSRTFSYSRHSMISIKDSGVRQNGKPLQCICIQDDRQEFKFGSGIEEPCQRYIAALIASEAARL